MNLFGTLMNQPIKTEAEAEALFYRLDADGGGTLSRDEFMEGFKEQPISFKETTFQEAFWTLLFYSRRESGHYRPKKGVSVDVNHPWGRLFNKFTPQQKYYYFVNVARQFLEAFVLNGLSPFPYAQLPIMLVIQFLALRSVLLDHPYTMLAQSRTDMVTRAGAFLVYVIAFLHFVGALGDEATATTLINMQFLMLVNNVITQASPAVDKLIMNVVMLLCPPRLLFVETLAGNTLEVMFEDGDTIAAVKKKIWEKELAVRPSEQRLAYRGNTLKEGPTIANCELADKI